MSEQETSEQAMSDKITIKLKLLLFIYA